MADGLDRKDATTPENDLGTEVEPAPSSTGRPEATTPSLIPFPMPSRNPPVPR